MGDAGDGVVNWGVTGKMKHVLLGDIKKGGGHRRGKEKHQKNEDKLVGPWREIIK